MNIKPNIIAVSLLLSPFVLAEETIEEAIVTATKFPIPLKQSIATSVVITAEDIKVQQPRDLPDLLGSIAGLQTRDSGGRGSVNGAFSRGYAPGAILVLIDGVRSASATTGATDLTRIPLSSIERIEVVKGPLSSLYGADAAAGVIQIFTKKAVKQGTEASINFSGGSFNHQKYDASAQIGTTNHKYSIGVNYEREDGIDRTTDATQGNEDDDAFEQFSIYASADFSLNKQSDLGFSYLFSDNEVDFDNPFEADGGQFNESRLHKINANYKWDINEQLDFNLKAGYFIDEVNTPPPSLFPSEIETSRFTVSAETILSIDNSYLTGGIDYYTDKVDTTANFPVDERNNVGIYLQFFQNTEQFAYSANIRYDDNEAYGNIVTGNAAVRYSPIAPLDLSLSRGRSFRAPNFNELFFPGFGNPDVQPEVSDSIEARIEYQFNAGEVGLSIYRNYVDNLIAFDPNLADTPTFVFGLANNIQEATLEGIEINFSYDIDTYTISGNYEYLDARNDTTGNFLTDRARSTGYLNINKSFDSYNIGVNWRGETGRHGDDNGLILPGFGIIGVRFSQDIDFNPDIGHAFSWHVSIDNLFDKEYFVNVANNFVTPVSFFQTEGINFNAGITFNF